MKFSYLYISVCVFFASLCFQGCDSDSTGRGLEIEEANYRRGQQFKQQGRNSEALNYFLKVIDLRGDAPESHLEVGLILLNHIKDPISAVYHFKKYLELNPSSQEAPMVSDLINTSKKEFLKQLPGNLNVDDPGERVDWVSLLKQTKNENQRLRKQVAILERKLGQNLQQQNTPSMVPKYDQVVQAPASSSYKRYKVEPGDTLSRISIKLFGDSVRWEAIFEANRNQLKTPRDLRVGQSLIIPN